MLSKTKKRIFTEYNQPVNETAAHGSPQKKKNNLQREWMNKALYEETKHIES